MLHRDGDSFVLDELQVWEGTRDEPVSITMVERAIADAAERFPGLHLSADLWQLKGSIERLRRERVRISEYTFSQGSVQKLSATLHNAISSAALRVYPDPELEREILGLRVVESSSGWRFDHRTGGYSDRAVALAMAVQLGQGAPSRIISSHVPRGRIGDRLRRGRSETPTTVTPDGVGPISRVQSTRAARRVASGARDPLAELAAELGLKVYDSTREAP